MVSSIPTANPDFDQEAEDSRHKMIVSDLDRALLVGLRYSDDRVRRSIFRCHCGIW